MNDVVETQIQINSELPKWLKTAYIIWALSLLFVVIRSLMLQKNIEIGDITGTVFLIFLLSLILFAMYILIFGLITLTFNNKGLNIRNNMSIMSKKDKEAITPWNEYEGYSINGPLLILKIDKSEIVYDVGNNAENVDKSISRFLKKIDNGEENWILARMKNYSITSTIFFGLFIIYFVFIKQSIPQISIFNTEIILIIIQCISFIGLFIYTIIKR